MITQVSFVSIPVADQQRALAFYTEKLGFEVTTNEPMGEGARWIELKPKGGAQTGVVLFTPPGQEDRIGTFATAAFACDDVRKTYEELHARGVEFTMPPTDQPWGVMAQFKDSEGNTFVVATAA
jgi:predicted enzyme related to lactoylglutathione lyase